VKDKLLSKGANLILVKIEGFIKTFEVKKSVLKTGFG
jgi:hypothetical protein